MRKLSTLCKALSLLFVFYVFFGFYYSVSAQTERVITDADLTGSEVWFSDTTYFLDGIVYLETGTLYIEPGTVIKALNTPTNPVDSVSMLIITRDARIEADGNAGAPIIFTSEFDPLDGSFTQSDKGFWGGIAVLGYATVNAVAGQMMLEGFSDARALFGGADDGHDAGYMQFVSIRYTGAALDPTFNNFTQNGLTFGGIGNYGWFSYIEIFASADDALEIFGGAVSLDHILLAYSTDDLFDTDAGYRGNVQFLAGLLEAGAGQHFGEHDGGIDNDTDEPQSLFKVSNATFIGPGNGDAANNRTLRYQDYSGGSYFNSIFTEQPRGVHLEYIDGGMDSYFQFTDGNILIFNNIFFNVANGSSAGIFSLDEVGTPSQGERDAWAAELDGGGNNVSDPGISQTNPLPVNDVSGADFSGADPFFHAVDYKGAFNPAGNWAGGWTKMYGAEPFFDENFDPTLVAFYPFDGNADDISGNGYNGIIQGAWNADTYMYADFYNTFGMTVPPEVFDGLGDFTISMFLNIDQFASQFNNLVSITPASNISMFATSYVQDSFYVIIRENDSVFFDYSFASPISIHENEWFHYAVTRSDDTVRVFVNGIESPNFVQLTNVTLLATGDDAFFGGEPDCPSDCFDEAQHSFAIYDDIAIYNRPLSSLELSNIYGISPYSILPYYAVIPRVPSGSFSIDGLGDDVTWGGVGAADLQHFEGDSVESTDFSSSVKVAWDSTAFYAFINVFDDNIIDYYGNPWENDFVELYFDFNKSKNAYPENNWFNMYDYDEHQVRIAVNMGLDGLNVPDGINFVQDVRADGYSVEIEIPWTSFNIPGFGVGQSFGFNVVAYDQDDGPNSKYAWSHPGGLSNYQPATFGEIALGIENANKPTGGYMVVEAEGMFIPDGFSYYNFGNYAITPGDTISRYFEVINFGNDTLNIIDFLPSNELYGQNGFDYSAQLLEDESFGFEVTAALDNYGLNQGMLTFDSDDSNSPYEIGVEVIIYDFVDVEYTSESFTIDALDTETTWSTAITSNADNNVVEGFVIDNYDFSGIWKATWDSENLYLFFNYVDDSIVNFAGDPFVNDAILVGFDRWNDRDGSPIFDNDNGYYRFTVDGPILGENVDFTNVESHTILNDTGFVMEAKIPFTAIDFGFGVHPVNGTVFGFDVAYIDNDTVADYEAYVSWGNYSNITPDIDANYSGEMRLYGRPGADVEFNVDMSVQMIKGIFDPVVDVVEVVGSFNDWGAFSMDTLLDVDGDSIYTKTIFGFNAGEFIEFKYRMNGDWSQPHDFPGGGQNRTHTTGDGLNVLYHVFNDEYANDLELTELAQPLPYALYSSTEQIVAQISNVGLNDISNFDISFVFEGDTVTETVTETIIAGESIDYTFTQTIDISAEGGYMLEVWIDSAADEFDGNNYIDYGLFSQRYVQSFPYFEDFEVNDGLWTAGDNNGISSWEYGEPVGSAISYAYSGTNAWVTNLYGEAPQGERSWFVSPVFDFSNVTLPYLSFQKWAQLQDELSAVTVMYSVDTGKVWRNVGNYLDDTNWYNAEFHPALINFNRNPYPGWTGFDADWNKVTHHLSWLAGHSWVQFVIGIANDADTGVEGFAIDDVEIYDAPPQYNADIVWVNIDAECEPLEEHPISIDVRNQGLDPIGNFDVSVVFQGDTIMETFTGTINPGDTVNIPFSTTLNLYTREYSVTYFFEAFIDYPEDGFLEDNYVAFNNTIYGDYVDKPGWTSYNSCDGLYENRAWSIVESPDGSMWFSGFFGISRFDGDTFTHYTEADGLGDDYVWSSIADNDGNLWLPATGESNITMFDGTDFTIYDVPGVFGECTFVDIDGNVWFGSYDGDGVVVYDGVGFTHYALDQIGMGFYVNSIGQLPNNNIVLATDAGVVEFDGISFFEFDLNGEFGLYVTEIFNDSQGRTWFADASYGRLLAFDGGSWFEIYEVNGIQFFNIQDIDQAANGNLYFGGDNHLFRFSSGNWNVFTEDDGVIPSNGIYAVKAASDGKIWIGTNGGGVASYSNEKADVVFFVDMYYQYEDGTFDPAVDSVKFSTSLNNFDAFIPMTDNDGDGVYKVGFENLPVGTFIEYKYTINDVVESNYTDTVRTFIAFDAYNEVYDIFNDDIPADQCNANFEYLIFDDGTVEFYNNTLGEVSNFFWSFGDGNFSEEENPIYTYTYEDYFEVCLTVYNETTGCVDEYCDVIAIIDSTSAACNADFGFETTDNVVEFFNNSQGNITDYFWDFGDGSFSYSPNPVHTFNEPGYYEVYFAVYDSVNDCFDDVAKEVVIIESGVVTCNASFNYFQDGSTIVFTNNSSSNVTDYFWSFGDGGFSYEENPTYTYEYSDFFEVSLVVYDEVSDCVDEEIKYIAVIDSNTISCNANFNYIVNSKKVTFTNASEGSITDYFWDFGDGNFSYEENPEHTYAESDFYEVWLTVYDEESGCLDDYFNVVVVIDSNTVTCNADFTNAITGTQVNFTNRSQGTISDYFWSFGDGNFSYDEDPEHTYDYPGYYEVALTVYDETSGCLDETWKTIFVIDTTQSFCNADFEFFINNKTVTFNALSEGDVTDYFWNFGDGTFAYSANPTKTYDESDFYEVSLTVYDEVSGCIDEHYEIILVIDSTATQCNADYSYFAENTTFTFNSESLGEITDYFWDFGDGYYSYEENPTHTYEYSDFYYVCLSVYDEESGCLDEYCEVVVVVDSTANLCNANFEFFSENTDVVFTSIAQGDVTDHFWSFGDGYYSTDENPTHTYDEPDFYEVCYVVYDEASGCLDEFCDIVFVVDTTQTMCVADFSVFSEGTTVSFSNESQGAYNLQFWDFGDGNYSFDENPTNTYAGPGFYEVGLTIYDEESGCIDDKYDVVVVVDESGDACNARFDVFTEGSTAFFNIKAVGNYSQIFWDFGDGFNSNDTSPSHTYTEPGYYEVWLSVIDTNTTCFDSRSKVIFIEGESGGPVTATKANFSFIPQADDRTVKFYDESFGDPTSWYWDFGDNTPAGSEQNPTYVYESNNYYEVNLTVANDAGSQDTYTDIIAVGDVSNSSFAYFTYFADLVTSTGHFKNESRGNIVSYSWDFGDGYGSEQENPSHTYETTGYYAVCLTTTSATGEVKTYCNDVRIDNSIDNPCLFSCVWPGDANNDLEANHYDIMTIGLNFGETGPRRDSVSNFWIGHFGQNWSTFQDDGTNNKHGDCNGDGVIDWDDTLAIDQNFAFSHFFTPGKRNNAYDITVEWDSSYTGTKATAGKARARMSRLTKAKDDGDIYAIGYEIEVVGGEGILFNSIRVEFNGSWLGTYGEDLIGFYALDSTKQTIYVGMSRTDQTNVNGGGDLIDIYFNFLDGYSINGISFIATSLGGIDASGLGINIGGSFSIDLGENLEFCQGESATIDAGEGFASYQWSNNGSTTNLLTVTETGKYYVTVTDSAGTSAIDSIFVQVNSLPVVDLGEDIESEEAVMLDAGEGFAVYLWQDGSNGQTFEVTETGEYWVQVTDMNGCQNADTIHVDITTIGIETNTFGDRFEMYPNPNAGKFYLNIESNEISDLTVELINIQGQKVFVKEYSEISMFNQSINVQEVEKGIYYLKVVKGNDYAIMKMIIQ